MILLLNYQIVDEGQTYMNTPYRGVVKYYVGTDMFGWGQSEQHCIDLWIISLLKMALKTILKSQTPYLCGKLETLHAYVILESF